MRAKYIEQRFPRYFEFGEHADGRVDLATPGDSTVCSVSKVEAQKLIKQRNEAVDMIERLASALEKADDTALRAIWYPSP